ncbi:MAG TPA: outer membrane beta-barrel protein [Vicinamibacterales bacterium]|jgi:opacity protein-like surface antigen
MRRRSPSQTILIGALLTLAVLSGARSAGAADGALASANVAATSIGDGLSTGVTGAFAYQFTNVVGFGVEVMWVPTLTPKVPQIPDIVPVGASISPYVYPTTSIRISPDGGRAVIVTSNVRLQIPTTSSRVVPYVIAGGGAGTVRQDVSISISFPGIQLPADNPLPALGSLVESLRSASTSSISTSSTNLALTLGGGINVYTTDRLAIDVDLRYLSLLGDRDVHVGRFGAGITYKF